MAMVKPIGVKKNAFDATKDETFYFNSSGGDAVYQNRLVIRDNSDNIGVYNKLTGEGYTKFSQTVPKNTLKNGKNYNYYFVTYNINGEESEKSNPIQFYCFDTPILIFDNIREGQTIYNSSYEFTLNYSQKQNELLNYVKFYVYNSNNELISESDNIVVSELPPNKISYKFDGFNDEENYYIYAKAITINGQIAETEKVHFFTVYKKEKNYDIFNVSNECSKGYNDINVKILNIKGELTPPNADYIDGESLDISRYGYNVLWKHNVKIDKSDNQFILQLWFKGCNVGKIATLGDVESGNYFQFNWVREIPNSQTELKDYIEVYGYINNIEKFYMRTEYLDLINNLSNINLWFKYDGTNNDYELKLNSSERIKNHLYWNEKSEYGINYGMFTDIRYDNNSYLKEGNSFEEKKVDMYELFPIEQVQLFNGIYDHINITTDIRKEYSVDIPTEWNYYTVLDCDFKSNVNGGVLNFEDLDYVRIKSRMKGDFDWITIKNFKVDKDENVYLSMKDYRVPSYTDMEYSLVLVNDNLIESDYSIKKLDNIMWNKVFVSDLTGTTMILESNVSYSDIERISDIGEMQPINSKYPTVIQNGEVDYDRFTISGLLVDDRYIGGYATKENKDESIVVSRSRYLDRKYLVNKRNQYINFLKNGKTKIITDWNGNCWVGKIVQNPSFSPMQEIGNGLGSITFSFVEQGKWNNQQDLYETNLVEKV